MNDDDAAAMPVNLFQATLNVEQGSRKRRRGHENGDSLGDGLDDSYDRGYCDALLGMAACIDELRKARLRADECSRAGDAALPWPYGAAGG